MSMGAIEVISVKIGITIFCALFLSAYITTYMSAKIVYNAALSISNADIEVYMFECATPRTFRTLALNQSKRAVIRPVRMTFREMEMAQKGVKRLTAKVLQREALGFWTIAIKIIDKPIDARYSMEGNMNNNQFQSQMTRNRYRRYPSCNQTATVNAMNPIFDTGRFE